MNALLLGTLVFTAVLTTEIVTEVSVENIAQWNHEMFVAWFWDISPNANGTESERLAQRVMAKLPPMDRYDYLCSRAK